MDATNTIAPPQAIMHTPGLCGGRACIRMTRIPVWLLVSFRRQGADDAELLYNYPSLTAADLAAAWDYHSRHMDEIEADILDEQRED